MQTILDSLLMTFTIFLVIPFAGFLVHLLGRGILMCISRFISMRLTMFIANRITFVGVVHHELSHAAFAVITGAEVSNINLFKPNQNSLGSVSITPRGNFVIRSIQLMLSSIAPVITGCISLYLIFNYIFPLDLGVLLNIVKVYIALSILLHMEMSFADIKGAFKGLPVCFSIGFVVVLILSLTGVISETNYQMIKDLWYGILTIWRFDNI